MIKHCYKDIDGWWCDKDAEFYAQIVNRFNDNSRFVEISLNLFTII